jgi:hypothetical protein
VLLGQRQGEKNIHPQKPIYYKQILDLKFWIQGIAIARLWQFSQIINLPSYHLK